MRSTRTRSPSGRSRRRPSAAYAARRDTVRCIFGGLPSSTSIDMSTGFVPKCGSATVSWPSAVASPSTAYGQRSRSHSARNSSTAPARSPARSAPATRCTTVRPGSCPTLRCEWRADRTMHRGRRRAPVRAGVRQAAGADVMHGEDRVVLAHLPAAVDHFLRAPLDFRVAALHRREVEVGGIGAGRHA
jgi:hypothetical protein